MSKLNKFKWPENVKFEPGADNDFASLDNSQRLVSYLHRRHFKTPAKADRAVLRKEGVHTG